jgi:predicted nucleic acid-binding protein
MSELELLSLPSLQPDEFVHIGHFIRGLVTVPVDSRIARIAGTIRRRSHIKSPDAAIAATAILTGRTLITRNVKDFEHISNLSIQSI